MKLPLTGLWLALLTVLLSAPAARAYPPAPNSYIYGLVRDQFGNPLVNTADTVILQTPSGVQVSTTIQPNLAIGINYLLTVPMDSGTIYTPNELTQGTQYQLYVTVNGVTNLPIEMEGVYLTLAAPSQQTSQNLTVGADVNNDGVPDAWETAFLKSLGINLALTNINGNAVYTKDGRTLKQEYELNNYPYNSNAFNVQIVSQKAGSATLAFTTTSSRTYTAYGSADLQNWTPLAFTIPANGATALTSYYSSTAQPIQIQTVQPTNSPTIQFFRLELQ